MASKVDLRMVDNEVRLIKSAVERLNGMGENFPAIARSAVRIQASVKMLELNISDYLLFEETGLLSTKQ